MRDQWGWEITEERKRKGKLPLAVIQRLAQQSTVGGVAHCTLCGKRYGAQFIKLCYVSMFKTDHVCDFCRREKGLQTL